MRLVTAGGTTLYMQHDIRPNFGLGDAMVADEVRIEWPSGNEQVLTGVAADQILHVVEPPTLTYDTALILSWPVDADGWALFGADEVDGPFQQVDTQVVVEGNRSTVTVPTDVKKQFYKLRLP